MKKIGICTINDNNNYGNRLQNYALQELLKNSGFSPETIINNTVHFKKEKVTFKNFFPRLVRKIRGEYKKLFFVNKKRKKCFEEFNELIVFHKNIIDDNHIDDELNEYFDYFFTGSDQVWNPTFPRFSSIDFLTFADKRKRNSFSASIGIDNIPETYREDYVKYLMEMNNISVREEKAKIIIEDLTQRTDIEVLLDPTMLVELNTWEKVIKKPVQFDKNVKGNFILVYFLGKISPIIRKEIKRVASENDCKIINLLDEDSPFYQIGPSEFLWLEKNAFLVCTDSFHSAVFAILYNNPFIIFERDDFYERMNSRLETLLAKFNLENRKYDGISITDKYLICDYTNVTQIISSERKKADLFIKKIIKNDYSEDD